MALPERTHDQFVSQMVATWSAFLGFQPSLQDGDALLAFMHTIAGQLLFIQAQIQIVNALARAQTSTGGDLDTFYAQFNFPRLPATFATGQVTFTKFSAAASQILIPAGTIVQTPGGAIQYAVVADTTQPTWNATLNAYVLAVGQTSLNATVQALVAGANSNVLANQLGQIGSNAGVDQVTNGASITNGLNAETDTAYSARFVLYINSLSKAIMAAIQSALLGVQQNIQYNLLENENTSGVSAPGQFVAVVDDGSGAPPTSLITKSQTAINAVRGFTILATAIAVAEVSITISISVRLVTGYLTGNVDPLVQTAILNIVNTTPIGGVGGVLVYISEIEGAALGVQGVLSVQPGQTKINGTNADFSGTGFQVAKTVLSSITVGSY